MWDGGSVRTKVFKPVGKLRLNAMNAYIVKHRETKDFDALNEIIELIEDNPFITVIFGEDYLPEAIIGKDNSMV